ncbi:MAG TPA: hypothetical protein VKB65_04225, partial [Myxococcota bacterium]|nr:hypothetical protein [Myxococcota bacterium]
MQSPPEVLLLHDGELPDVAALLGELEVEWIEARAGRSVEGGAPLVIGTPARLLRFSAADDASIARIAICDGGSRSLDRKLEAHGIDFVLRRPV